jgi:hypothetical protein
VKNRETSLKTDSRCIPLKLYSDNQILNNFVRSGKNIYTMEATNIKEITSVLIYIGKFSKGLLKM